MTHEQFLEVKKAVNEAYLLHEIYNFLREGTWTEKMFEKFIYLLQSKARSGRVQV